MQQRFALWEKAGNSQSYPRFPRAFLGQIPVEGFCTQVFGAAGGHYILSFVAKAPFKVLSIQVDGGSEFMAEFEDGCAELGIPLIVLPPKKPKYNRGVERSNRIFQEEFYSRRDILADSIGAFNAEIKSMVQKYNTYRPHSALKGLTPIESIQTTLSQV